MRVITLVAAVSLILAGGHAYATAQYPDDIQVDGQAHPLFSEPLRDYLEGSGAIGKLRKYFSAETCSASWRGYRASWKIVGSQLKLIAITANPCSDKSVVPLDAIFPEPSSEVFASWYSGVLLVPLGKQTRYVHMGYVSEYEKYLILSVKAGHIFSRKESRERPK